MKKAILTMLVAVVLGGVGVYAVNRHDNTERAITLAKNGRCLSTRGETNEVAIKNHLRGPGASSVSSVQGWKAQAVGNDTYLVWFEFTGDNGKKTGIFIEVNLNAETALCMENGSPMDEHYKPLKAALLHHRRLIDKILNR